MAANSQSPRNAQRISLQIADRTVTGVGLPRRLSRDVFHRCMTVSWSQLVALAGLAYLLINFFFMLLYGAVDGAVIGPRPPQWLDLFFYSCRVFGTASFGAWLPGNIYGESLVVLHIICGIASYSVMTGLAFARFTRPQAQMVFAHHPVIFTQGSQRVLMFRVANIRHNFLTDTLGKVWVMLADPVSGATGGAPARRFHRLSLVREENPVFALSWTLIHVIDEKSPLHGLGPEQLAAGRAAFTVIVTGHDEDYADEVRGRHIYAAADLRWDHQHVDIFSEAVPGQAEVDFTRFHEVHPVA